MAIPFPCLPLINVPRYAIFIYILRVFDITDATCLFEKFKIKHDRLCLGTNRVVISRV